MKRTESIREYSQTAQKINRGIIEQQNDHIHTTHTGSTKILFKKQSEQETSVSQR